MIGILNFPFMKIKNKCILLLICILFSCTKNISRLNKQEISFYELPQDVQDTLAILVRQKIGYDFDFIFLDNKKQYYMQRKEIGPYLDGYILIDSVEKRKFKLSNGIPFPIIIYNKYLFHPQNYNLLMIYGDNIEKENFVRYKLE